MKSVFVGSIDITYENFVVKNIPMIKPQVKSWRNDARYKVTGEARFINDLKFHGMLNAVPAYSGYIHAKVNSINTLADKEFPRFIRVITVKNIYDFLDKVYGATFQNKN